MQKNSENFSMQEALRMASTPAGQRLLSMLQHTDPNAMKTAMEQASAGNYGQAKETLSALLQDPEIQKLMQQLGG